MKDMMNTECPCGKGVFIEMYLQDDWGGILHCNICKRVTNRLIPIAVHRDSQIEKILK